MLVAVCAFVAARAILPAALLQARSRARTKASKGYGNEGEKEGF